MDVVVIDLGSNDLAGQEEADAGLMVEWAGDLVVFVASLPVK